MSLIKKQYCPQCGSDNVVIAEPSSGQMMCKECFYCGNDFPEEDVVTGSSTKVEEVPTLKMSTLKTGKKPAKKAAKKTATKKGKGKKR